MIITKLRQTALTKKVDKNDCFNIKTGFIFAGMLVLIGLTCYATLNWN